MTPTPSSSRNLRTVQIILLATVAVLLAVILVVLAVKTPSPGGMTTTDGTEEARDDQPNDPEQSATRFMTFVMVDRDPNKADNLMCDDYAGPRPQDLFDDLSEWENDNDILADAQISTGDSSPKGSRSVVDVQVKVETDVAFTEWHYEVSVKTTGTVSCVSEVRKVAKTD